jgi:hypothetical protein
LAAEQHALRRLARRWPRGLFAAARGAREKALLGKQADVIAAQDLAVQAQVQLAGLQRQLDEITDQLAASHDIPAAYTVALTRKEQQLRSSDDGAGRRLDELAGLRHSLLVEVCELRDTANLTDTAVAVLERVAEALDWTASWSAADILGGGALISRIKDDELDDAMDLATAAEHHLSVLREKVTGMPLAAMADGLYVDAFTRFADISLDNTLIDLSVHHRISAARDQVDTLLWQLCEVRARLTARITAASAELYQAEAERETLLRAEPVA